MISFEHSTETKSDLVPNFRSTLGSKRSLVSVSVQRGRAHSEHLDATHSESLRLSGAQLDAEVEALLKEMEDFDRF